MLATHEHKWVAVRKGFPQRFCRCGAIKSRGMVVGEHTISVSPAGVGDVIRWSATKAPVAAGDIGMDVATGRLQAFISGAAVNLATTTESVSGSSLRGYIDGLILSNNVGDATNDIDIATGTVRDGSNTYDMALTGPFTKRLDAAWAVGSGNGGLDTGAKAASTWYHMWIIRKDSDASIDALFSTSATAPTMPAGYTAKRRIGAVRTDAGSALLAFTQLEDEFLWTTPISDVAAAGVTTATLSTLTVPLGIQVDAIINFETATSGGSWVTSPSQTDEAPSTTVGPFRFTTGSSGAANDLYVKTNTSSQIRHRETGTLFTVTIRTRGWIDPRGRNN